MPTQPRAGDTTIAIDREVAQAIAELCAPGESPNACLRRILNMPNLDNQRRSNWRLGYVVHQHTGQLVPTRRPI